MAEAKFLASKPAGGVTTVIFTDGASNTSLVLPESGSVASTVGATVDNTLPRYDGINGKLQSSGVIIDDSNNVTVPGGILSTGTARIGYGTGAGGTVTQLTSKSTLVELNKPSGTIIMSNASLPANAAIGFSFYNSLITPTNIPLVSVIGGDASGGSYTIYVSAVGSGFILIYLKNMTGASRSEAVQIKFEVFSGSNS